ncbi:hypothetical protein ACWEQ8_44530, partial [Streptomyces noursei]
GDEVQEGAGDGRADEAERLVRAGAVAHQRAGDYGLKQRQLIRARTPMLAHLLRAAKAKSRVLPHKYTLGVGCQGHVNPHSEDSKAIVAHNPLSV